LDVASTGGGAGSVGDCVVFVPAPMPGAAEPARIDAANNIDVTEADCTTLRFELLDTDRRSFSRGCQTSFEALGIDGLVSRLVSRRGNGIITVTP
jgi:hypothetical protein